MQEAAWFFKGRISRDQKYSQDPNQANVPQVVLPAQVDTVHTRNQDSSDYLPKGSPTTLPFLNSNIAVSSASASICISPSYISHSSHNTTDWHNQSRSRPRGSLYVYSMETRRSSDLLSPNPLGWLPPKGNHRQNQQYYL